MKRDMPLWFKEEPNWRIELCRALKIWLACVVASVVGIRLAVSGRGPAAASQGSRKGTKSRGRGISTELHLDDMFRSSLKKL